MLENTKKIFKNLIPAPLLAPLKKELRALNSVKYLGNTYRCPFCRGRFSSMLPSGFHFPVLKEKQIIGGGYRENTKCPKCSSIDRERLIYLYLKTVKKHIFSSPTKLLHIAPEKQLGKELRTQENINYLSADLYAPHVDIKMDITNITDADECYDVIICNHVLEHIDDDILAMSEIFRVLKTGGFAILQVPISYVIGETYEDFSIKTAAAREQAFGQDDHVRIYSSDYKTRLEKVGFSVEIRDFTNDLPPEDIKKYALLEDEKIFVCSKK